MLVMHVRFPWE